MTKKRFVRYILAAVCCISMTLTAFADVSAPPAFSDTNISFSSPEAAAVRTFSAPGTSEKEIASSVYSNSGASDSTTASGVMVSAPNAPFESADKQISLGTSTASAQPVLFAVTKERGESLGMFTTTGYCNCSKCNSKGHRLTYSGTIPQANHTVSADLTIFPVGTKLMIGSTIYTVEDNGEHIKGNKIDIYYENHEDAWNHGEKTEEVFAVNTFQSVQN